MQTTNLRTCVHLLSFLLQISPVITPHNHQFVHHMVVFLCPSYSYLPPPSNYSDNCHRDVPNFYITICTNTRALGSWAIGGEVCILWDIKFSSIYSLRIKDSVYNQGSRKKLKGVRGA